MAEIPTLPLNSLDYADLLHWGYEHLDRRNAFRVSDNYAYLYEAGVRGDHFRRRSLHRIVVSPTHKEQQYNHFGQVIHPLRVFIHPEIVIRLWLKKRSG